MSSSQINELRKLLDGSRSIVITSHIGPDGDSISSSLLLRDIIDTNFSDKKATICLEEEYKPLSFLAGYDEVEFSPLSDALVKHQPQLLVILDANNIARCTRNPEPVQKMVADEQIKVAIIDHHEPIGIEPGALYVNRASPAVTQDVYEIFFNDLILKKPDNYAQTAMVGLYSDTGGFTYDNPKHEATFKMASELIDDGASAELAANQLTRYTREGLEVLEELIKNIRQTKDCTYSFISDEFYDDWLKSNRPPDAIHEGFDIYLHNFMRNIDGRFWGFAIYPDQRAATKTYSVSFRSLQGRVDVSEFARKLGGGGHKPAAGAKIQADSVKNALASVKEAIALIE